MRRRHGESGLATLNEEQIRLLLAPYIEALPEAVEVPVGLYGQLRAYLELLLRWNERTNLTAIRAPEEMVQRHFGESLFAGGVLGRFVGGTAEVLDFGSGAGFPGLPVQLLLPQVRVTLAESQGKKAAFLREVVRSLGLRTEVWAGRVEAMPVGRCFDAVMLRAVDRMGAMVDAGRTRVRAGGVLVELTGSSEGAGEVFAMPQRSGSVVRVGRIG